MSQQSAVSTRADLVQRLRGLRQYPVNGSVADHADGYRNETRQLVEADQVLRIADELEALAAVSPQPCQQCAERDRRFNALHVGYMDCSEQLKLAEAQCAALRDALMKARNDLEDTADQAKLEADAGILRINAALAQSQPDGQAPKHGD